MILLTGYGNGGYRGQEPVHKDHIKKAFDLLDRDHMLVLSGGNTQPELNVDKNEAEEVYDFALNIGVEKAEIIEEKIIFEKFARDSFENLFFSLLAFKKETGDWPQKTTIVSFNFKKYRFNAISIGLKLPILSFLACEDIWLPAEQAEAAQLSESNIIEKMIEGKKIWDPLQRAISFREKREQRRHKNFKSEKEYLERIEKEYGFGDLLKQVEELNPGPEWKSIDWPWHS